MIRLILSLLFVSVFSFTKAQLPAVDWQRCIGTEGQDDFVALKQTPDGGYIALTNTMYPNSGDFKPTPGKIYVSAYQSWIIKFDRFRNVEWTKGERDWQLDILGSASANDYPHYGARDIVVMDNNQGYYIIGNKASDLTSCCRPTQYVMQLDIHGNLKWFKRLGADNYYFKRLVAAALGEENTLIACGSREQGENLGWVIKFNTEGDIIWDKDIYPPQPHLYGNTNLMMHGLTATKDGGIVITGKIQPDKKYMFLTLWVIKLDGSGNKLWEKFHKLGGDQYIGRSVRELPDSSMIIGTNTVENIGIGRAGAVKVSKSGDVIWNILFPGQTWPIATCDVAGSPSGNFFATYSEYRDEQRDIALVKISSDGYILWKKYFGGSGDEVEPRIVQVANDSVVTIACGTFSADGDVKGNHGGTAAFNKDVWLFSTGLYNTISGYSFIDYNGNNVLDGNETFYTDGVLSVERNGAVVNTTAVTDGKFLIHVGKQSHTVTFNTRSDIYTASKEAVPVNFGNSYFNTAAPIVFPIKIKKDVKDMKVSGYSPDISRSGFDCHYILQYYNLGSDTLKNSDVYFIKDSNTAFVSAYPPVYRSNGDTLFWHYSTMAPLDTGTITLRLNINALTPFGDTLRQSFAAPIISDQFADDNSIEIKQLVRSSYDPNDKNEMHGGSIPEHRISKGEKLTYLIRFQNTGNDTAFKVRVTDTLPSRLLCSSIKVIGNSHPYKLDIEKGNIVHFTFNNILLPDSNTNEAASHGYVAFQISPRHQLKAGDSVINKAAIYFDFNLPVITDECITVVKKEEGQVPVYSTVITDTIPPITDTIPATTGSSRLVAYPNPASGSLVFLRIPTTVGKDVVRISIYSADGTLVQTSEKTIVRSEKPALIQLNVAAIGKGVYFVRIPDGKYVYSTVWIKY